MTFLEDDILRLRAVEPNDSLGMFEIENDSSQWMGNGLVAPFSLHNLTEYARNYDADPIRSGQIRLIIDYKETHETAGIVDLYDISAVNRTGFIGIYICEKYRGRDIGLRSIMLIERYASMLLNLRVLGAKVSEINERSRTLFEKAGFTQCGNMPGWHLFGGKSFDLILFSKKIN